MSVLNKQMHPTITERRKDEGWSKGKRRNERRNGQKNERTKRQASSAKGECGEKSVKRPIDDSTLACFIQICMITLTNAFEIGLSFLVMQRNATTFHGCSLKKIKNKEIEKILCL